MIAWTLGKHKQCLIIASALRIIIEREKKTVVFLTKLKHTTQNLAQIESDKWSHVHIDGETV